MLTGLTVLILLCMQITIIMLYICKKYLQFIYCYMSIIPQLKKKNQLVVSISMAAKLFWVLTFILVKSMAQINFSHFEFRFFL